MHVYQLMRQQMFPMDHSEVFAFFADASNLERITPPWLRFEIKTSAPIAMAKGTEIRYRLQIHGIPITWRSLIPVWNPPYEFVDVQTHGPYKYWHHLHTFDPLPRGTIVRDYVHYSVPGGVIFGPLVNALLVKPWLNAIFNFREMSLANILGNEASSCSRGIGQ